MTRTLSADSRKAALEDCELKIRSAFRRGLEATCIIAKELHKIYSGELYAVVTEDFTEYITDYLRIDLRSYRRIVSVSQTVHQLQEAGLELPANESQVAELSRLQAPLRARVWNDLVIRAEKEDKVLTVEDVRKAVEIATEAAPHAAAVAKESEGEVEVEMDFESNGNEPVAKKKSADQDAILILSEKGEAALSKIRKVCGDAIADAIADGTKALTEREIKNWSEYDNEMMRQLVFFVFDQNFPLHKAVSFINKEISDDTDVHDLILIASSRGGSAVISYDKAKIAIELKTPKP